MKIAVIDSGVNAKLFDGIKIQQVRCYNNTIVQEEPNDYFGHGTAITSCLFDKYPDFEYLSICPGVDEDGGIDSIVEAYDMANAIRYAVDNKAEIINISMGTTDFSNRECIDEAVMYAFNNNTIVVASAPNETKPSLPWACKGAIKVREQRGNGYKVSVFEDCFKMKNFAIRCQLFRVLTENGKKIFAHGNSYSTVWITLLLIKLKLENQHDGIVELCAKLVEDVSEEEAENIILSKFDVVERMEEIENSPYKGKKFILYSWTKEMHSIVRGTKANGYTIVGVVDYCKKGYIGKDIGILSKTEPYGVTVSSKIEEITAEADTLVVGYLDQIADKDPKFTLDYILDYNLKNNKFEVFSFSPVSKEWKEKYKEASITLRTPYVFNYDNCNEIFNHVHNFIAIKKPVLGVFGTSSKQGKFTLQMNLKEQLKERNISCFHLSTEHQAAILGANITFADGYENNRIMEVDLETKCRVLRSLMTYIDNISKDDFILVGGQSWVIPFDIKNQTFMRYAIFLEAVQPDRSIVVINPLFDSVEYVKDTLAVLNSLYKCKTIAIAFSDHTPYIENNRIKIKELSTQDIKELSDKWSQILCIPCGCITDSEYLEKIVDYISYEFS